MASKPAGVIAGCVCLGVIKAEPDDLSRLLKQIELTHNRPSLLITLSLACSASLQLVSSPHLQIRSGMPNAGKMFLRRC